MKIVRSPEALTRALLPFRRRRKTVGFVPTMGDLHAGHLSLVHRARREADCVVVSIFVNPKQFGPKEDFKKYPRRLSGDAALLRKACVDILFAPSVAHMYPADFKTEVNVGRLSEPLCGRDRPGHFKGVATVVARLFGLVGPARAYFGLKDFQQAAVIRQMVRDLALPVTVVPCPLVRDRDGVALSSRNRYLSPEERIRARALYASLKHGRALIRSGVRDGARVKREMEKILRTSVDQIHYVSVADPETLEEVKTIRGHVLLAVAARVGRTRLIDNAVVGA